MQGTSLAKFSHRREGDLSANFEGKFSANGDFSPADRGSTGGWRSMVGNGNGNGNGYGYEDGSR
jgi:hypothetical protein